MREWLTVIIVLLIIGIVLDGVRRMRQSRRDSVRMTRGSLGASSVSAADQDDYTSELPNGGARVVAYREPPEVTLKPRPISAVEQDEPEDEPDEEPETLADDRPAEIIEPGDSCSEGEPVDEIPAEEEAESEPEAEERAAAPRYVPEQGSLNLDEAVPLLMESVEDSTDKAEAQSKSVSPSASARASAEVPMSRKPEVRDESKRIEPSFSAFDADPDDDLDTPVTQDAPKKQGEREEPFAAASAAASAAAAKAKSVFSAGAKALAAKAQRSKASETREPEPEPAAPPAHKAAAPTKPASSTATPPEPEEVLVINIMAPEGERFLGPALLDALLASGLRFGSMAIFHRHSDEKGKGPILFSLANMVKPGVFDLESMETFSTPGVSLFMTLPLEIEGSSIKVFDLMADAARDISNALGGELKDENRSVMTRQTLEHCRQRVAEFERKQLSRPHH